MREADFRSSGWRIPFLLSILLLGVGWFVRARVPETPIFEEIKRRGAISRNPFVEAILMNPRSFLVAVGLKISEVSWVYILTIFIVVYATSQLNLPRTLLLSAIFVAALVEMITIPLFGWLSDHIGRRIFHFLGTLFTACFAFPMVSIDAIGVTADASVGHNANRLSRSAREMQIYSPLKRDKAGDEQWINRRRG